MGKLMNLIVGLTLAFSYLLAVMSAIFVWPYLWMPLGLILVFVSVSWLYKYTHKNIGVVAVGILTNGTFISLGQYLESVIPALSIVSNILGTILSVLMMVLWYYYKEGQRHVEVRIKRERLEDVPVDTSFIDKVRYAVNIVKKIRNYKKDKQYSLFLAFQFAYIEQKEELEKSTQNNAIDFVLGKEVVLQRNEYDQGESEKTNIR